MVHHRVMSVSVYLHLQGLVFLQEIALKKKVLNYCQHFVESVSDRIWTQQFWCFSAAMPLLPASPTRHFVSPYWSSSLSLQQTRVWKSSKQHQKSRFVFFGFVVFLFFPPQSDHRVLGQIKGGPSGQETIKVTCCERMQSDMWRYFYWHLFGCCSVGKKSTFQSWFYRVE